MKVDSIKKANRLFDDQSKYLDHFGLVLTLTAIAIVLLALVDLEPDNPNLKARLATWVTSILVALALVVALRAAGLAKRWMRLADVLIGIGVLAALALLVISAFAPKEVSSDVYTGVPTFIVVLAILTPLAIIRRLLRHRHVTRQTLIGAVSVYLLIPMSYYYLFIALNHYGATQFFGQKQPTESFMYFSLTTVTTTGYGDLTAVTPLGRLLANSEAVIGQLYLVTVVAMIVGLIAATWNQRNAAANTTVAADPSEQSTDAS